MSHIILLGNEKGGSGKTTSAMHIIITLLRLGFKVSSIDIDSRQKSLSRYIENRELTAEKEKIDLHIPNHFDFNRSIKNNLIEANKEEEENFNVLLSKLVQDNDFIVIDTPGSDNFLNRLAHSYADIIITPINDSFIDVDLIGKIEVGSLSHTSPGVYSSMLWEQKLIKAKRSNKEIQWIVVRNRLSHLDAINKRNVDTAVKKLSKRFGFKIVPGFCERVIFKELFLNGLTLHDADKSSVIKMNPSVVAARQELREFIVSLGIKEVNNRIFQR